MAMTREGTSPGALSRTTQAPRLQLQIHSTREPLSRVWLPSSLGKKQGEVFIPGSWQEDRVVCLQQKSEILIS